MGRYKVARENASAFHDVVEGNNWNNQDPSDPQPQCPFGKSGFNATSGWDPVTGLGTPNMRVLVELALAAV